MTNAKDAALSLVVLPLLRASSIIGKFHYYNDRAPTVPSQDLNSGPLSSEAGALLAELTRPLIDTY